MLAHSISHQHLSNHQFFDLLNVYSACAALYPDKNLNPGLIRALRYWLQNYQGLENSNRDVSSLVEIQKMVEDNAAAQHPWYQALAQQGELFEFCQFMMEEALMPAFLPLLYKARSVLQSPVSIAAIDKNINEETHPVAHAQLFAVLLQQLPQKFKRMAITPELCDLNLVYLYGYFLDPWFLIGALYATEHLFQWRAAKLWQAGKRLNLPEEALTFHHIHSVADEIHAQEWLHDVIAPHYVSDKIMHSVKQGVIMRLTTSRIYLDQKL